MITVQGIQRMALVLYIVRKDRHKGLVPGTEGSLELSDRDPISFYTLFLNIEHMLKKLPSFYILLSDVFNLLPASQPLGIALGEKGTPRALHSHILIQLSAFYNSGSKQADIFLRLGMSSYEVFLYFYRREENLRSFNGETSLY